MKIFRQPPPGKMALLGDQMVASLGNHRVFVFFRFAIVTQHTAMAGCPQQKGGKVSEEDYERERALRSRRDRRG